MNVHGRFRFAAPREDVFHAVCDPGVLMAVIPGCESIEQVSATDYRGMITLRLPGVTGRFATDVRLLGAESPERAGMEGRVDGTMGSIHGHAEFILADEGDTTTMDYQANAVIHGPLARLDSGLVEHLADTLITQGLRALDHRLAGVAKGTGSPGRQPTTEGIG